MNEKINQSLALFHQAIATRELTLLDQILAEDVVFRSPFLWKPKHGKSLTRRILQAASTVFEDFSYHRQLTDGTSWVLEFSAHIGDVCLKGIDLIRFNEDGAIVEFEVMIRPAKGLQALGDAMARQLMAQGDWEVFTKGE